MLIVSEKLTFTRKPGAKREARSTKCGITLICCALGTYITAILSIALEFVGVARDMLTTPQTFRILFGMQTRENQGDTKMKKTLKFGCGLIVSCLLLVAHEAQAIMINFSDTPKSSITFVGNTFSFVDDSNGFDFSVTSVTGGAGSSIGLFGNIQGNYTVGAISTLGSLQSASVTGNGSFSITDASNIQLTANVAWIDIFTNGTAGGINAGGAINLTNVAYTGTNSDLLAFVTNSTTGIGTVTFQFIPAKSLTTLTSGAAYSTSYSGSITNVPAVPEGGSALALLGLALVGIEGLRRKLASGKA